jgi:hypothetical protein
MILILFVAGFLLLNGIGIFCVISAVIAAAKASKEENDKSKPRKIL